MRSSSGQGSGQGSQDDAHRLPTVRSDDNIETSLHAQGDHISQTPNGVSIKSVVLRGVRLVQVVFQVVLRFIVILIVVHIYRRGLRPRLATLLQWLRAAGPVQEFGRVTNLIVTRIQKRYITPVMMRPLPAYANYFLVCGSLPFAMGFVFVKSLVSRLVKLINYGDTLLVTRKWPRFITFLLNAVLMIAEESVRPFVPLPSTVNANGGSDVSRRLTPSRAALLFFLSEAIYPSSRLCGQVALTPFRMLKSALLCRRYNLRVAKENELRKQEDKEVRLEEDQASTGQTNVDKVETISTRMSQDENDDSKTGSTALTEGSSHMQKRQLTNQVKNEDGLTAPTNSELKAQSDEPISNSLHQENDLLPPMTPELFDLLYGEHDNDDNEKQNEADENENENENEDKHEDENEELELDKFIDYLEAGKDPIEAAINALKHDKTLEKNKDQTLNWTREERVTVSEINITVNKEIIINASTQESSRQCSLEKVEVESSSTRESRFAVKQHVEAHNNSHHSSIVSFESVQTSSFEKDTQSISQDETIENGNSSLIGAGLVDTIPDMDSYLHTSTVCDDSNAEHPGESCLADEGSRKYDEAVHHASSNRSVAPSFATSYATTVGGLLHRTSLLQQLKSIELLKRAVIQPPTISSTIFLSETEDFDAAKWLAGELLLHLPFYQHYCGAFLELKKRGENCDSATLLSLCMNVLSGGDLAPKPIQFSRWCSRMWTALCAEVGTDTNTNEVSSKQTSPFGDVPIFSRYSDIRRAFTRLLAIILSLPIAGLMRSKVSEELCCTKFVQLRVAPCAECGETSLKHVSTMTKEEDEELNAEALRRTDFALSVLHHAMLGFLKSLLKRGLHRARIIGQLSSPQSVEVDVVRRKISEHFISKMTPKMSALARSCSQATSDERKLPRDFLPQDQLDDIRSVFDDEILYVDPADTSQNAMIRREIGSTITSFLAGFGKTFDIACDIEEVNVAQTCSTCKVARWPARLDYNEDTFEDGSTLTTLETLHEQATLRGGAGDQQKTSTPPRNIKASSKLLLNSSTPDVNSRTPPLCAVSKTPDVNSLKHHKFTKQETVSSQKWEDIPHNNDGFIDYEPGVYFWESVDFFAHRLHLSDSPDWTVEYALIDAAESLKRKQDFSKKKKRKT